MNKHINQFGKPFVKGFNTKNPKKVMIKKGKASETMIMEKPIHESSQILEFGYIPSKQKLHIKFKQKGALSSIYAYENVKQELWEGLKASESHGKYFAENIKKNPEISFRKIS